MFWPALAEIFKRLAHRAIEGDFARLVAVTRLGLEEASQVDRDHSAIGNTFCTAPGTSILLLPLPIPSKLGNESRVDVNNRASGAVQHESLTLTHLLHLVWLQEHLSLHSGRQQQCLEDLNHSHSASSRHNQAGNCAFAGRGSGLAA